MADKQQKGRGNVGERNPCAKLSEEDVRAIKHSPSDSKSIESLAKRFNVSPTTVYDVVAGRTWSHVS
jgi:Mor family transcriptional regulator